MRYAGILLHISSLPNEYGIGTLGEESYQFVDFLHIANQKFWQVLPIGPTSYGDSPYQSFSVFAGNPYFIDYDLLARENLLDNADYEHLKLANQDVDYYFLFTTRFKILKIAFENFKRIKDQSAYEEFKIINQDWLHDYALFMSLKERFYYVSWQEWPIEYKNRHSHCVIKHSHENIDQIEFWKFVQYIFFKQWNNLKEYANQKGVEIIGDMPIYASLDSADCWSKPYLWQLDKNLFPSAVAGVPPDLFSKTGQLWGNPLYDYQEMKKDSYSWWHRRIEISKKLFDWVRIDHFRGFESYYSIPANSKTAQYGSWVKGPGRELFDLALKQLGILKIIAEDLGFITEEVRTLLKETKFPGMKVLQFGFDKQGDSEHAPHNHVRHSVIYPGTHDNPPIKAWYQSLSKEDRDYVNQYLCISKSNHVCEMIIKECLKSVCQFAIIPMQDYLELGSEGRMNTPSIATGNWKFRIKADSLSAALANKIKKWTHIYKRGF